MGTYRKDQLEKWVLPRGLYNYPIRAEDSAIREAAPGIGELWLYAGKSGKRRFAATYEREVTAEDLAKLGYPRGKGKPHAEKYLLFRIEPLPEEDSSRGVREEGISRRGAKTQSQGGARSPGEPQSPRVLLRLSDFVRSAKVRARLRKQFAGPDAASPKRLAAPPPATLPTTVTPPQSRNISYFDDLPEDLLEDWLGNLCVCEAAEQLTLWDFRDDGGPALAPEPRNAWDKAVEVEKSSYQWTNAPVFFDRTSPLLPGKPNVLELFCGCGGTSCGFEMAGYQTVMGADILAPAVETFRLNHPTASAWLGDIREIPAEEIARRIPGPVDVVIAGIPCQGFSLNNRKRHDGDGRNSLYLELLRILRVVRPKCVVVENVSGIQSSANGEVVREIERGIFDACGLTVRHKLLNAAEFGVPQRRSRVVFVGVRDPAGFDFGTLKKTNGPGTGTPFVTVREAIGDLPPLSS